MTFGEALKRTTSKKRESSREWFGWRGKAMTQIINYDDNNS